MTIHERLGLPGSPLGTEEALRLWLGAIRSLSHFLPAHGVHPRLGAMSFEIDAREIDALGTENSGPDYHRSYNPVRLRENDRPTSARSRPPRRGESDEQLIWPLAAPEQTGVLADTPDQRTNIYNLGALGFQILTGHEPYFDRGNTPLVEAILRTPLIRETSELRESSRLRESSGLGETSGLTPLLAQIIAKATAKRPEDRYQRLSELETSVALAMGTELHGKESAIVGRDAPASELTEAIAGARAGMQRQIAIIGEPGIGKSYLWQTVAEQNALYRSPSTTVTRPVHDNTEFRFSFKSSQIASVPYKAIGSLLDSALAFSAAENHDVLISAGPEVRTVASRISPRAAELVGDISALGSEVVGFGVSLPAGLARILSELLSAERVSILVFDDLQWLDVQSLTVLHELLRLRTFGRLVVLIGRPEARSRIPGDINIEQIELHGLTDGAGRELIDRTVLLGTNAEERSAVERLQERLFRSARGNPLALLTLARRAITYGDVASIAEEAATDDDTMLTGLALSRLSQVDEETRQLLSLLSLLSPPVDMRLVAQVDLPVCRDEKRLSHACDNANELLLVTTADHGDTSRLQFAHDTIELAVRRTTTHDRTVIRAAVAVLAKEAASGNEHAIFALAELLVPAGDGDVAAGDGDVAAGDGDVAVGDGDVAALVENARSFTAPYAEQTVLAAAALRSGELLAAEYALRYAESAIARFGEAYDGETRLRLHETAHEAAYLLDNPYAMSRHFQRIRARADTIRVNEARQLWISRAYAKSIFLGSIQIGLLVLRELGVDLPSEPDSKQEQQALRYLRMLRMTRRTARLRYAPWTQDHRADLIVRTCTRIALAIFVARPFLYPFMIGTVLRTSLKYGPSPQTGLAFVYWAMILGNDTNRGSVYYRMGQIARAYSGTQSSEFTRTTIEITARVFTEHWGRDYRETYRELHSLFYEALRIGNFEWAGHAGHIYCVGAFHNGEPLRELFDTMEDLRTRISELGLSRTARALAKYQQAVESLLGLTPNPLELTGSIDHERSEIEAYEREHDYTALVGVYYLRGILGVYADLPDRAYPDFRRAAASPYMPTTLVDVPIIIFYWGCTAWRVGQVDDGRTALKKLRLWACEVPVNHEHRYRLVRAEKQRYYRRYRAAERDYRKSIARAVEREYIHEAALAAERLGDLLADRAKEPGGERLRGQAASAFYHAYSLYARWGAVLAAERVRKRLGWGESPTVVSPVLAEKAFVERLVGSESGDTAFRITLDELVRLSAADEGYLRASVGERVYLYRRRPVEEPAGTVARIEAGALPGYVARLFAAAGESSHGEVGTEEANALLLSSSAPAAVSVAVVLANRAQRERFSQVFAARAQSALLLATTVLGLRRLSETADEQSADLTVARQALVAARENQQRLLAALETALLLIDEHAAVLVANPAAARYLEPSDGVERRLAPAIEEAVLTELGEHNAPGSDAAHFSGERELAWNERILRLLVTPTAAHTVVSIDDVTVARRREHAFEQQRRELIVADRMSSIGMLAAATAHEVGNPNHILQLNLQSLLVVLERLETDGRQTHEAIDRAREFAAEIGDASGRIEEVIRGIKEYGRSGRGHTRERQEPEAIAGRALRFSRILASQYTDAFHYVPAREPLPEIEVVPGLLEQALINLIKNACEALAERSQIVEVRTGLDTHTGEVVFSVCDQGRGLPAWAAAGRGRAFHSEKSEADGTGLGLSIVNSIVEQHHGRLEVTAADGFTTVFELRVPSAASSCSDVASTPEAK